MTKQAFLSALRRNLSGIPKEDLEERLAFYAEMVDDRMEEGLSEEEAVAGIGTVEEVTAQIVDEIPLTRLVRERIRPRRRRSGWEIALLLLGAPVWLPLLLAAAAVLLAVYVTAWAVILSLWASFAGVALCAPAGILAAVLFKPLGGLAMRIAFVGVALVSAGLAILFFFGCLAASRGLCVLTKKLCQRIKRSFVKREDAE